MKILSLEISSPNNEYINDLKFNQDGISIIYGDVKSPEETGKTSNSLGKTILLSFIDFIYGKEFRGGQSINYNIALKEYIITAKVLIEATYHTVVRIIGSNTSCYIDEEKYKLQEYLNVLQLNRTYIDKQFFLQSKKDDVFSRQYPSQNDYLSLLNLLNINKILEDIDNIYNYQNSIKEIKEVRKTKYGSQPEIKEVTEELYFISEDLKAKELELKAIKEKVSSIDTTSLKKEIISDYNALNAIIKENYNEIAKIDLELERLEKFISAFQNQDIESKQILRLYEQAHFETPDLVRKRLEEVEQFNKSVVLDRTNNILEKTKTLKKRKEFYNSQNTEMEVEINKLGKIISENKVYIEQLEIYSKYNSELNDLKYRQGQLSDIKNYEQKIESYTDNLTQAYIQAKEKLKYYTKTIDTFRSFINGIVKRIYNNNQNAFFDIKIKDFDLRRRPISIELNFQGDSGEGLGNVKKLLIDYLVFYINDQLQILVQDSSCYNGIDPRQKIKLLKILNEIAKKVNKQAIISINKYEFFEDNLEWVEQNSVIKLSEKKNLFGFKF